MLLDPPLEPDGSFLHGEPRVGRLPLTGLGGKDGLRDQADRGGSQGTDLHRRRADVGGGDADQVAAEDQDYAAGGSRREPTDLEGRICVRCAGHACRLRVGNRKPSGLKPTTQMACCQKATRNEAKRKHASKSGETAQTERAARDRSPAGVTLAPLCQTFGNWRRSIYYFCRKNEKKVRRGDSRGVRTGSRTDRVVPGGPPRGLFDFSVVRRIFLWRAALFLRRRKTRKIGRRPSRAVGKGRTLE